MTTAQAIREMMAAWEVIVATARRDFPSASEEEIFQIASGAMRHTLKI